MPALKRGEVSFIPDYAGSLLTFLDPKKPATTDPDTNATQLAAGSSRWGSPRSSRPPAQDINGFVVTKATADKYGLVNLSDLAKPAPYFRVNFTRCRSWIQPRRSRPTDGRGLPAWRRARVVTRGRLRSTKHA